MKFDLKSAFVTSAVIFALGGSAHVLAQNTIVPAVLTPEAPSAPFVKKRYNIKGTWDIIESDGQNIIRFNEDFKTKGGPDLKVYLSSQSITDLKSDNVTATSLKLSVLKSNKGQQSYIIPPDVNLSDYKSVLIHCEAFSVLWGGFDL